MPATTESYAARHLGTTEAERQRIAEALGYANAEALVEAALPPAIRRRRPLALPPPLAPAEALAELAAYADANRVRRSYLGLGYHDCHIPPAIQRHLLEDPRWYTPYTAYQAEISQGRLEMLLNFQTLVSELTGLPVANASLLDEATAAAEALRLCAGQKPEAREFLVVEGVHAQTIAVLRTRAAPLGIALRQVDATAAPAAVGAQTIGALVQYPDTWGRVRDWRALAAELHRHGALLAIACDPLALCLLEPPAAQGADIALGCMQRFGTPLGYGGPHAAFFAVRRELTRALPGRLVGISKDRLGQPALRLALQTREQHIRREKAASNICTAQALLACASAAYAIWHGREGLQELAARAHRAALRLAAGLRRLGYAVDPGPFFDTVLVSGGPLPSATVQRAAAALGIDLRLEGERLVVALDETVGERDLSDLWTAFAGGAPLPFVPADLAAPEAALGAFARDGAFLEQPVFRVHRSEAAFVRYLATLAERDYGLTQGMIPLGSCTMKWNSAATLQPLAWPGFARLHPAAPADCAAGYRRLFADLERWLAEITEMAAVSLQPNSGAQGEYAGLLAIRAYQRAQGEGERDVCLIPLSAHGTNPASAALAGLRVVPVACDRNGNVDLADLARKVAEHRARLCCLMATYPSTHGVFEAGIVDAVRLVHDAGGQVYLDGANLNALVGVSSPGSIGADVCHINLHKTFAIPHGGGGPGMGPIAVASHLAPYLPSHPWTGEGPCGPVSAAPWGSASILPISWAYIRLMGAEGLRRASQAAILAANWIAYRLHPYFPVLYRGPQGLVAHECILDVRPLQAASGVSAEDIAKRLIDYGFHAPTLSFPVPGTLMVEPTESEPFSELERFCQAMIAIHGEILAIIEGRVDRRDHPLAMAPHPAVEVCADQWTHPYPRSQAAYPLSGLRQRKFWPAVARVDNAHGDRHLQCTCASVAESAAAPG
ncbi:MAG: aminomethyl-transferring glycine dehydrogenase [Planctomycetota bacterium]|nr:aminomethyl-transferring glycine dehydrogenase [Planctomycetota bacterium]